MLNNLSKYKVILASQSPRRKELLSGLGIQFDTRVIDDIDETYPTDLKGEDIPLFISNKKADAYAVTAESDELIITADTVVLLDDKALGKPQTDDEAIEMLQMLSGNTHKVSTGVCILTQNDRTSFVATTNVTFANLTEEEIRYYVSEFRPHDKAGAYGIQEWIGFIGVTRIEGSYFNVMGLPVQRLYTELKKITK